MYWRPVKPVRGSVLNAAVKPQSRFTSPLMVDTTSSENLPRPSVRSSAPVPLGWFPWAGSPGLVPPVLVPLGWCWLPRRR